MALQAAYERFLQDPSPSALATNASLHYITTTTSFQGQADVAKHLSGLRSHLKKTKESALSAVESRESLGLVLEVDTTIEFIISGGPYLPSLDDNFVADRKVQLPITHFVTFDSSNKIVQIRQAWDQGSLLKQLDVIGKSGRNWPIRDSSEQIKLIAKSAKAADGAPPAQAASDLPIRSRGNSTNALRDPHASLSLFVPRAEMEPAPAQVISPYAGTRPRQRDISEILGAPSEADEDDAPGGASPSRGRGRSSSPSKDFYGAPKAGVSKTVQPVRLFEGVEEEPDSPEHAKSPERSYRPHPKKYEHFDFADGTDTQDAPPTGTAFDAMPKTKHNSQWSFDDFVTPSKPRDRPLRAQEVRHWDTDDNAIAEVPVGRPLGPKPRRDAEPHFEFQDDGEQSGPLRPTGQPRGAGQNEGLGLYKNNLYSEEGGGPDPAQGALGNITNIKDRRRDFNPQFGYSDESPKPGSPNKSGPVGKPVAEDRKKVVKMMESNWSAYDESPVSQKENNHPAADPPRGRKAGNSGIAIAGDGMGGKKGGAGSRGWSLGDDEPSQTGGIAITGDGMGGKKGASGRGWSLGDESDNETQRVRPVAGKKQGAVSAAKDSFWDF